MILGSLLIGATRAPMLNNWPLAGTLTRGNHCSGSRYVGRWSTIIQPSDQSREILIPQRDKRITASYTCIDDALADFLLESLESLDGRLEGLTQREKYDHLIQETRSVSRLANSNFAAVLNTESTHGSISLLSVDAPIQLCGLYVPGAEEASLVWSIGLDDDLVSCIRRWFPLQYLAYRFPTIQGRSVFIPTQIVCSHWWRYIKARNRDTLFAFNALELKLYKGQE